MNRRLCEHLGVICIDPKHLFALEWDKFFIYLFGVFNVVFNTVQVIS